MAQTQVSTQSEQEDEILLIRMQENDPTEHLRLEDAIVYYQSLDKAK